MMLIGDEPQSYPSYRDIAAAPDDQGWSSARQSCDARTDDSIRIMKNSAQTAKRSSRAYLDD